MYTNLAQKTASDAVKWQRGNTHSWRSWVMVRFLVTSEGGREGEREGGRERGREGRYV